LVTDSTSTLLSQTTYALIEALTEYTKVSGEFTHFASKSVLKMLNYLALTIPAKPYLKCTSFFYEF